MKKTLSLLAVATVAAALSGAEAAAQSGPLRSDVRGFSAGMNLSGSRAGSHAPGGTASGGLGVSLGYGVNDALTLFARTDYGYRRGQLDVGGRFSFGAPTSALRPYAEAGLTGTRTDAAAFRATGLGATASVGAEYFITPNLSLDAGVGYTAGRHTSIDFAAPGLDTDRSFAAPRVNLGFRWHP
ncbi:MAG TPA: outer membrane beta-barrel protein [Longimicrobium sp.]|jgi:opacity protein-like surface antigen